MNQDQRKFLIKEIENQYNIQRQILDGKMPNRPSLNNYLIAAFLDNSIQFADIDALKKSMREEVIKLGKGADLVESESSRYRSRRYDDDDDEGVKELVKVDATKLFIIPQNYLDALADYKKKRGEIRAELEKLLDNKNAVIMKVQLSSAAALANVVNQVDQMGDLNLFNASLQLAPVIENEKKQLK